MSRAEQKEHKAKAELITYINVLMVKKGYTQDHTARLCGKTQGWLSKKLQYGNFYAGELIRLFSVLDADPTEIGRILKV